MAGNRRITVSCNPGQPMVRLHPMMPSTRNIPLRVLLPAVSNNCQNFLATLFSIYLLKLDPASAGFFLLHGLCDLGEQESTAAAIMLQDTGVGFAAEERFAKGGIQGGVDSVGHEYEADIAAGK